MNIYSNGKHELKTLIWNITNKNVDVLQIQLIAEVVTAGRAPASICVQQNTLPKHDKMYCMTYLRLIVLVTMILLKNLISAYIHVILILTQIIFNNILDIKENWRHWAYSLKRKRIRDYFGEAFVQQWAIRAWKKRKNIGVNNCIFTSNSQDF